MVLIRFTVRLLILSFAFGLAASPVHSQAWLLGRRADGGGAPVKVKAKQLADGRIRVNARAAPRQTREVAHAILTRLAEMSRAEGKSRFVLLEEKCSMQTMYGSPIAYDCSIEAVTLQDGEATPPSKENFQPINVADILDR
jgi:hypothetical protein